MGSSLPPAPPGPPDRAPRSGTLPGQPRPRRPWYLTASLVLAWLVGAFTVVTTTYTLSFFHTTSGEISLDVDRQPDLTETERTHQKAAFEAYTAALRAAKSRALPLTIAELLIGAAMVVFSQRATAGRPWARRALVQLTIASVVASAATWVLTPDLRGPRNALQLAMAKLDASDIDAGTMKLANLTGLAMGMFVSAVTLLGLSVARSRAFYEATPATET